MNSLLLNKIARAALLTGGIISGIACAISCKDKYENQKGMLMLEQYDDMDELDEIEIDFDEIEEA